jgi:hypothetical protein
VDIAKFIGVHPALSIGGRVMLRWVTHSTGYKIIFSFSYLSLFQTFLDLKVSNDGIIHLQGNGLVGQAETMCRFRLCIQTLSRFFSPLHSISPSEMLPAVVSRCAPVHEQRFQLDQLDQSLVS